MRNCTALLLSLLLTAPALAAEAQKKPAPPTVEALQTQIKDLTDQNSKALTALVEARTFIKALQVQRNSLADTDAQLLAAQATETQRYADQLNARRTVPTPTPDK